MMSGGAAYDFAYPPLAVLLAAPLYAVVGQSAVALLSTAALIAGTVLLWLLLPAPWRSAATAVCLGFGFLPQYARHGYPAVIALALLIPVVVRWPATGARGRLGRPGTVRALCLGAACAAQQLPWFLLPFLLAGLYAVRRGELGARPALGVVARYAGRPPPPGWPSTPTSSSPSPPTGSSGSSCRSPSTRSRTARA